MKRDAVKRDALAAAGFTLVEIIAVVAILAGILAFGALNVRPLDNALQGSSATVVSAIQQARSEAIASTSAVRLSITGGALTFTLAADCSPLTVSGSAARTVPPLLGTGVSIKGDTQPLNVCLSSRGEASRAATLTLTDRKGKTMTVSIFLAGGSSAQ